MADCPECGAVAPIKTANCPRCGEPLVVESHLPIGPTLRRKIDVEHEIYAMLKVPLGLAWMFLGILQTAMLIAVGGIVGPAIVSSMWSRSLLETYLAAISLNILITGLLLTVCGLLLLLNVTNAIHFGFIATMMVTFILFCSPLIPFALIYGIVLAIAYRVRRCVLYFDSAGYNAVALPEEPRRVAVVCSASLRHKGNETFSKSN